MEVLSTGTLFTGEKLRGAVAGAGSGCIVFSMNLLGVSAMGLSAPVSSVIFLYIIGNFVAYVLDILFAKERFVVNGVGAPAAVPYSDLGTRAAWLLSSFSKRYFFRFVVSVIIEALTGIAMLQALIKFLDRHKVMDQWKMRDPVAAIFVAIVNFMLFVNILRFDWAYQEVEHPILDIVILMWMVLTLLAVSLVAGHSDAGDARGEDQKKTTDEQYS